MTTPQLNLLLVDDQPENLLALEALLGDLGHRLVKAGSGREALRRLLAEDFALILLDIQMPEMDGFETAQLIRGRKRSQATPIIFLTATMRTDEMVFRGYTSGAVDYLIKPIVSEILRAKVQVFAELAAVRIKLELEIVERKRAQDERERFFSLSRDMLCIAGFDGYFKRLNPAWEKTLGYTEDELLDKPFLEFVHSDDREATQTETLKLAAGREVIAFENRYRCKDGSYKWLFWSATSVAEQQFIYAGARDCTEQKKNEEEILTLNVNLQRHTAELEATNEELEAFSYSVSHDLRAPLRHIDGFVQLLKKGYAAALDEKSRSYLSAVGDAAKQMGQLIDDLLAFSRMGRAEMRVAHVNLEKLIQETIHDFRQETEGREVVWEIGPLPGVQADGSLLRQVLVNLLSNAVKYSRTRSPAQIEIGCKLEQQGQYVFFVRDNGVGFDMRYADKLFGVFQRLHRAEDFEGTGIGLANVRRIITRHGGHTWAEGKVGVGATFYFSLPKQNQDCSHP